MIGKSVSHFKITEKLGQGGMGIVYKAHDTKLNRTVALKFLPAHLSGDAETKARFIQEAQSASSLDHPNICVIYDIGETDEGELYIAMAFYDGDTLKYSMDGKALSVNDATSYARQIGRALERAHEAGIVHRDVKPANIMLTKRGEIKLLDFGLAKLAGGMDITKMGSTVGTAAYMSPEQMKGDPITSAADVWSLGTLYYEMLTGEKPFKGEYDQALMYGILNESPTPVCEVDPSIPKPLSDLVDACMVKDPSQRMNISDVLAQLGDGSSSERTAASSGIHPSAMSGIQNVSAPAKGIMSSKFIGLAIGAVMIAVSGYFLWSSVSSSAPGASSNTVAVSTEIDQSVAVLPFRVNSTDETGDAAVLAEGIHGDVLAHLARIADLRVISRTSVMQYDQTTKALSEIASELGVATILEGSLQRAGDRIRVNVSLINAATDAPLWGETYDQELTAANIFAIQSDLAGQIAEALHASLTPAETAELAVAPEINMEAYDLYTRSMYLFRRTAFAADVVEAATMMEQVVELEPDYAQAHTALAMMYNEGMRQDYFSIDEYSDRTRSHIETALELDPLLPDAYIQRGTSAYYELRYEDAEKDFLRAIELAPGDADSYRAYSNLLYIIGRPEDALASSRLAVSLDPLDISTRSHLADVLFFTDDIEGSIAESERVLVMEPRHTQSLYNLGYGYAMLEQWEESITSFKGAVESGENDPVMKMGLAWAYAKSGDDDQALSLISELEDTAGNLREKAIIHGILGDLDTAFSMLDRAMDINPGAVLIITGDTSVDPAMRADPRFDALVERLGLESN